VSCSVVQSPTLLTELSMPTDTDDTAIFSYDIVILVARW
jgi:hypothetical protein